MCADFKPNLLMANRESPYWLLLAFCPKILGVSGDLWVVIRYSTNTGLSDVDTPRWWGQSNPTYCNVIHLAFCTHRYSLLLKSTLTPARVQRTTWWNFHYLVFSSCYVMAFRMKYANAPLLYIAHHIKTYDLIMFGIMVVTKDTRLPSLWWHFVLFPTAATSRRYSLSDSLR